MQQLDTLRKRVNPGNEWFRIGLASATVVAPLVKRWSDLRDADSSRMLREEAEARWKAARSRLAVPKPLNAKRKSLDVAADVAESAGRRSTNAARIWLIGVGVGLVVAGAGAYFLVQRRMRRSLEEPLVDLPLASSNGHTAYTGAPQTVPSAPGGRSTASAPAATPEQPAQTREPGAEEPGEMPGGATTVTETGAPAGVADADAAPFVGNIHTMVYHDRDDENLPAEENRIYFASEDEAREQGYRRDRADVSASGSEATREAGGSGI